MSRVEDRYIDLYQRGKWDAQAPDDVPGSTSEQITIALSIERSDLLPGSWADDPLHAYKHRLDDRQRAVVNAHRGWSGQ